MANDWRQPRATDDDRNADVLPGGGDDGVEEASRGAEACDQSSPELVWPPTEDELDAWEVVPLGQEASGPVAAPPAVAPSSVEPAPVAAPTAVAPPTAVNPSAQAVVVRFAPPSAIGREPDPTHEPEPESAPDWTTFHGRLGGRPAAGATMAPLVIVPLLAILSAAAGFIAAMWVGPTLFPAPRVDPPATVVVVESREPGAEVFVNGEPAGTTPLRISMSGGETRIEVQPRTAGDGPNAATGRRVAPTSGLLRNAPRGATGSVLIRSTPARARVVLEGRFRGVTPLSVAGLAPGRHEVEIADAAGSTVRQVDITAGRLATLDVDLRAPAPAASNSAPAAAPIRGAVGQLSVRSAVPLQVLSGGQLVGTSTTPRIPLAPGTHDLQFLAQELEFTTSRRVVMRAGAAVALTIDVPNGRANFNAQPWAEVWLQGRRLGETPLGNVELPIGIHEVEFRHPQLGTRRATVAVRARTPARVSVRFAP